MSVLKNCSNLCLSDSFFRSKKSHVLIILTTFLCTHVSAAEQFTDPANVIQVSDYIKVLFGLFFVVGLFIASTFLYKRFGNGPMLGRGQLRVVDGLHLGNRERLMLVELRDKQILLAVTPGQIRKLDSVATLSTEEKPDVVSSEESINQLQIAEGNNA